MNDPLIETFEEKTLESELIFKGTLLELKRDRVALPDGTESQREYVKHQGAVLIIPVLDNGDLIFEHQYRYPLHQIVLELPAGKIDPGEDILIAAQRELSEETGYSAREWRHLGALYPCVGYSDEIIEIFLARELKQTSEQHTDSDELIQMLPLSLDAAMAAVRSGKIRDGKTIAGLFWAEKVLREAW